MSAPDDLYTVLDDLLMGGLDAAEEGDETLLRLARRVSKQIDKWDQDPCDPDTVETWDSEGLHQAPTKLLALARQLPEPLGARLTAAVQARQETER